MHNEDNHDPTALLGLSAAARALDISETQLRHLADTGKIDCIRDSANRRLFRSSVIRKVGAQRRRSRSKQQLQASV